MTLRSRLAALAMLALILAAPAAVLAGANSSSGPSPQVVGGTPVNDPGAYPFMVAIDSLDYEGNDWCGGSLIGPRHVLTAAHCVANEDFSGVVPPEALRVAIGYLNRDRIPENRWLPVLRVFSHPKFDLYRRGLNYDVAVLELAAPVAGVTPVRLPAAGDRTGEKRGDELTLIGWGRKYEFGPPSAQLRQVTLNVEAGWVCRQKYRDGAYPFYISLSFCTYTLGKAACNGDSGGPLMAREGNRWVQRGIVSGGSVCAGLESPDVQTRISNPEINAFIRESAKLRGS